MSLIHLSNINLTFNEKQIFKDFSLNVNKGEKILITGKSGKGKSTILKILLGFINYDSGNFFFDKQLVSINDFSEIRTKFAYVNQDVTIRPGKVKLILSEIATFSKNTYDGNFDKKLADLFEFDIALLEKETSELSGGERQRLGIIISIMLNRDIFLLDEVTSALDKNLKKKVVDYYANSNATVISISHDSCWTESNLFREVII